MRDPYTLPDETSEDGNAFVILFRVSRVMLFHGRTDDEIEAYQCEATSHDYTHLRNVSQRVLDELRMEVQV